MSDASCFSLQTILSQNPNRRSNSRLSSFRTDGNDNTAVNAKIVNNVKVKQFKKTEAKNILQKANV